MYLGEDELQLSVGLRAGRLAHQRSAEGAAQRGAVLDRLHDAGRGPRGHGRGTHHLGSGQLHRRLAGSALLVAVLLVLVLRQTRGGLGIDRGSDDIAGVRSVVGRQGGREVLPNVLQELKHSGRLELELVRVDVAHCLHRQLACDGGGQQSSGANGCFLTLPCRLASTDSCGFEVTGQNPPIHQRCSAWVSGNSWDKHSDLNKLLTTSLACGLLLKGGSEQIFLQGNAHINDTGDMAVQSHAAVANVLHVDTGKYLQLAHKVLVEAQVSQIQRMGICGAGCGERLFGNFSQGLDHQRILIRRGRSVTEHRSDLAQLEAVV